MKKHEFHVGGITFDGDSIAKSLAPDCRTRAITWWVLANCIQLGVPLEESLLITADSTEHPWFKFIFQAASEKVKLGAELVPSMMDAVTNFQYIRIAHVRVTEAPRRAHSVGSGKVDFSSWLIPNIGDELAKDFDVLAAEDNVTLDGKLFELASRYDGQVQRSEDEQVILKWNNIQQFFYELHELTEENTLLGSLVDIRETNLPYDLKEVEASFLFISCDSGDTFAKACAARKLFSNPAILAILKAGESVNKLREAFGILGTDTYMLSD